MTAMNNQAPPHPSYPNPTVREALCEIQFPAAAATFGADFLHLWPCFEEAFPSLEVHADVVPPVTPPMPGGAAIISGALPTRPRFLARRTSRPLVVQFMSGALTVNTLQPYLGWETFQRDIAEAWEKLQGVLLPQEATKITLRYINDVSMPSDQAWGAGWLAAWGPVPQSIANAVPPFHSLVQLGAGTPDMTGVIITCPAADGVLTVDFERTVQGPFAAGAVLDQVEALHEDVWELFAGLKGPRWNDVLEGKS